VQRIVLTCEAKKRPKVEAKELQPVSETRVDQAIQHAAIDILNRIGARQFFRNGTFTVGLWSAADTPEARHAIALLHPGGVPVLHLEDAPEKYRRYMPARLETEVTRTPCDTPGVPFAEWKAQQLNRGGPGRITAATIRHGERTSTSEGKGKRIHSQFAINLEAQQTSKPQRQNCH